MKRRLKRKSGKLKVVIIMVVIIALLTVVFLNISYLKKIKDDYTQNMNTVVMELKSKETKVFTAKRDITAGSVLTKEDVMEITVLSEQNKAYYMTVKNIGEVTLVTIPEGTWIYKAMLREEDIKNNLREIEYTTFFLSSNMKKNDYFDLHIQYPNGEDYIVLSKNLVRRIDQTNQLLYLWLTPEELFRVSGAIVDCYIGVGTRLYTTKYIEPTIQNASILTYVPNADVIQLMKTDPNIVDIALDALEEEYRSRLEERLQKFFIEHEFYGTNTQDNLQDHLYYSKQYINNSVNESQENDELKQENTRDTDGIQGSNVESGVQDSNIEDDMQREVTQGKGEEGYYVD
ncbi:MAG: SAF domain-containing protein [Anaerocolumna sp.]